MKLTASPLLTPFSASRDDLPSASSSDKFTRQRDKFGGAYYRKVASGTSTQWDGLEIQGVLPDTINFDASRIYPGDKNDRLGDYTAGPLDRPSIYTGGHGSGGQELDCGLTWDRVWSAPKLGTFTNQPEGSDLRQPQNRFSEELRGGILVVLDGTGTVCAQGADESAQFLADKQLNFAFRPFLRDSAGHWITAQPGSPEDCYFYPGEEVKITLRGVDAGHVQLAVERVGSPEHFSRTIAQAGFAPGSSKSFKRVNSVDQFRVITGPDGSLKRKGNEGNPVIPTSTLVAGARWDRAVMLTHDGKNPPIFGSSFSELAGYDVFDHYDKVFQTSPTTSQGGETLTIQPAANLA